MKARDNLSEPIAPSVGVVIERAEILQGCAVAELVLVLRNSTLSLRYIILNSMLK